MCSWWCNDGKREDPAETGRLQQELLPLEQRWQCFLQKLEEKYMDLLAAFEAEVPEVYASDTDLFKRGFGRFKSGVEGQLRNIREKARETADKEIRDRFSLYDIRPGAAAWEILYQWRERCLHVYDEWETRTEAKRSAVFSKADALSDPEVQYQSILDEYQRIKAHFTCRQCGSLLNLERPYFISTYITCPQCQTQNTFTPSPQARMLEHIARPLAEKRNAHLHELYLQHMYCGRHDDAAAVQAGKAEELTYYRQYLRAVFDEIHRILPELREQNEKFYERLLADHTR